MNNNEIFPTPLHQPKITKTRQDQSMNSCCIHYTLTAPSVCQSGNWDLSEQEEFSGICPSLVSALPVKGAEPLLLWAHVFRDAVIDGTVVTAGCFPVSTELPMFLFFTPLSVSSRDSCEWKSTEISRFWDTQATPGKEAERKSGKRCETDSD